MTLTEHCDVYAAFHEDGFSYILKALRSQRPSLFNYATAQLAAQPGNLCWPVDAHNIVSTRLNPLYTIIDPMPVSGTRYGLAFSLQVSKVAVDFFPNNVLNLPDELKPLHPNSFGLQISFHVGMGCPSDEVVEGLIPPPPPPPGSSRAAHQGDIVVIPPDQLRCFSLDAAAVGSFRISKFHNRNYLSPRLDRIEFSDIGPPGLENVIECHSELILKLGILPQLRVPLEAVAMKLLKDVLSVRIAPTPISVSVPHNPAIKENTLETFISVEVV